MRSLEGCETKFMQNFGFFKPFFKGFWPIIWAINPLCGRFKQGKVYVIIT